MEPIDRAVHALHKISHRRRLRFLRLCREATSYLVTSSRSMNVDEEKIHRGRRAAWRELVKQERTARRERARMAI